MIDKEEVIDFIYSTYVLCWKVNKKTDTPNPYEPAPQIPPDREKQGDDEDRNEYEGIEAKTDRSGYKKNIQGR